MILEKWQRNVTVLKAGRLLREGKPFNRRPPFQSLRKKKYQSKPYLSKASSVIFPAPGEFTQPIPQSSALLK